MISSLRLKNFQRHASLSLSFTPGVNVIVGASDKGKSALLRAVGWVLRNDPNGSAFVRHGTKQARVKLTVGAHTVERRRSKSSNVYLLDGKELKAFGNNVPEPVQQASRFDAVNFQAQHEPSFWFSLSGGEVSRKINEIIDLGQIDTSLASIVSIVRSAKSELEVVRKRKDTATEEFRALVPVSAASEAFQEIEDLLRKRDALVEAVTLLAERVALAEKALAEKEASARESAALSELALAYSAAVEAEEAHQSLRGTLELIAQLEAQAQAPLPEIAPLEKVWNAYAKAASRVVVGAALVRRVASLEEARDLAISESEEANKAWKEAQAGSCPLCGRSSHASSSCSGH